MFVCAHISSFTFVELQGGSSLIPGRDDAENFRKLTAAMDILSFDRQEQDTVIKILASVLHIGNIFFKAIPVSVSLVTQIVLYWRVILHIYTCHIFISFINSFLLPKYQKDLYILKNFLMRHNVFIHISFSLIHRSESLLIALVSVSYRTLESWLARLSNDSIRSWLAWLSNNRCHNCMRLILQQDRLKK